MMGYYGVFVGMQYRNDLAMTAVLDADRYNDSETFTIRIPVAVPYMTDQSDFQRVDGKFEHKGEHYRLVKQKYANDTLTVVCVRDVETKRINKALSDYVKNFSDQSGDQNQASTIAFNFIKDYLSQPFSLRSLSRGWETDVVQYGYCINLIPSFEASVVHPPERA
ncbi:MAG TPA: hypothetical protein VGD31_15335 [Sphingobacteriaceae bacterium]